MVAWRKCSIPILLLGFWGRLGLSQYLAISINRCSSRSIIPCLGDDFTGHNNEIGCRSWGAEWPESLIVDSFQMYHKWSFDEQQRFIRKILSSRKALKKPTIVTTRYCPF